MGDTDLSDRFDDVNAMDVAVSAVLRHPKYHRGQAYYDVALLRLERKIEYSDYIVPVCLPELPSPYANTHQGKLVTLTGWGKAERNSAISNSYLQRIHLGIFSHK